MQIVKNITQLVLQQGKDVSQIQAAHMFKFKVLAQLELDVHGLLNVELLQRHVLK